MTPFDQLHKKMLAGGPVLTHFGAEQFRPEKTGPQKVAENCGFFHVRRTRNSAEIGGRKYFSGGPSLHRSPC